MGILRQLVGQGNDSVNVRIDIPPLLRHHTNGVTTAEVKGNTVGDCLDNFVRQYPGTKKRLFDKNGKLLRYVEIYVNGETTYPEELARQVNDGDEISIVYLISGG